MENNTRGKRLRIAIVEPRGSGGMIHYAYQLCNALTNEGAEVTLVTSQDYEMEGFPHNFTVNKLMRLWSPTESSHGGMSNNSLQRVGQKIFWNARRALRGVRFIVEWLRLIQFLLKSRPDIVQFGKIEFPFEAIFLALLKRNGLILSQICHEFELREQGNGVVVNITNRLYRWVYNSFSIIFFHGKSNQERFSSIFQVNPNRFHLIPHGNEQLFISSATGNITSQELRRRYGIHPSSPVILFFGNLMPSKGIPDLLTAFARAHSEHASVRLIIAGKPSKLIDMGTLTQLASNLGVTETVRFDARYIPIEEVSALMEMAAVVVYPYLNSTQSGSLQVAYAFSRPVIATTVGGLPEAVEDGRSGFLVPPKSPTELSEAIMKFIENPNLTKEMGAYAKHLSETRFAWDTIARKILEVYEEAINQPN